MKPSLERYVYGITKERLQDISLLIFFFFSTTLIIESHSQSRREAHCKPLSAQYSKKHVPVYLPALLILLNANNN